VGKRIQLMLYLLIQAKGSCWRQDSWHLFWEGRKGSVSRHLYNLSDVECKDRAVLQWQNVPVPTVHSTKPCSITWAAAPFPCVPAGSWTQPCPAPAQGCPPSLATSSTAALRWCDPLWGTRPFHHSANHVTNGTFIDNWDGKSLLSYRYQMPHLISPVARCRAGTEESGPLHERISSLKDSLKLFSWGCETGQSEGAAKGTRQVRAPHVTESVCCCLAVRCNKPPCCPDSSNPFWFLIVIRREKTIMSKQTVLVIQKPYSKQLCTVSSLPACPSPSPIQYATTWCAF